MSKSWHADWLGHAPHEQQTALIQLLEAAPRLRQEEAHRMLRATGPRAIDEADAKARAATVIRYLAGGYRVGNLHPALETER